MRGLLICCLGSVFFHGAAAVAEPGVGTPTEVSCARAQSFEKTFRIAQQGEIFAAGWTGPLRKPVVARIAGGAVRWCREDLDAGGKSSVTGMIARDGNLFVALSVPASSGTVFERLTAQGWLRRGGHGAATVTVLLKLNAENGQSVAGTFLTASADNGSAAEFRLKSMQWDAENLRITAWAGWQPRMKNRVPMTCTGAGPFLTTVILLPDLKTVLDAKAERCVCCE